MLHLLFYIWVYSFGFLIVSSNAIAEDCNVYFSVQPEGNYLKKNVTIPQIKVDEVSAHAHVSSLVKEITGAELVGKTFDEAIDQVYKHLKADKILKPLEKADELAKFGTKLNPIFEEMLLKVPAKGSKDAPDLVSWEMRRKVLNKVKTSKYHLTRKINDLEIFQKHEFVSKAKEEVIFTKDINAKNLLHMKMKEYPKYVDSYLHFLKDSNSPQGKLYKDIKIYTDVHGQGTGIGNNGILTIEDIRDVTSYSLWPMYLKTHDIKHIHFSLTHPMALAAMMGATRSKNHLRYVLVAGMYEGVDRIQYAHEKILAKYFGANLSSAELFGIKRNMDLEEAMLTLSILPTHQLEKISELAKVKLNQQPFTGVENWLPKVTQDGSLKGLAVDGESFDQEINEMTEQFSKMLSRSEKIKKKILKDPNYLLNEEEQHFMKMMNYQLNPESPEIIINGLMYKNDGRAHYHDPSTDFSGANDYEAAIGIGEQ